MALLPILSQAKGPLPISASFDSPSDAPAYFTLTGSAWSTTANQMIGVSLELDGKVIGSAMIFSNAVSTHRALIPVEIPVKLGFGAHKITLIAATTATVSDLNDFFNVGLDY